MSSGARRHPVAYLVHSFLGFQLGLFVTFICLTGTVAVVADDLEWLYRPKVRATAGECVSWQRQIESAQAAFPDHTIDYANAGEESYLATKVSATASSGETRFIYVDPGTGRVLGESGWINLQSFLRALHSYLFAPGDWGFYAVTALGFVVAGSLASGLIVYKKFWRGLFRRPRWSANRRVVWGDLHRLSAVWSTWFVLVIALTSIWYLAERLLYRAGVDLDRPRARIEQSALDRLGPAPPSWLPLNELIRIARAQLPELEVREIWFPAQPDESLALLGQENAWLVRDRASGVELNPYTGDVMAVHRATSLGALQRWTHTADPIHFGDFGGLVSKTIWLLFGLLLTASAVSGMLIHAKRAIAAAVQSSKLRTNRRSSAAWIIGNGALVLAVPVISFAGYWKPSFAPETATTILEPSVVNGWEFSMTTRDPIAPGQPVTWRVHYLQGSYGQVRAASIGFGVADEPPATMVAVTGYGANAQSAELVVPTANTAPTYLWMNVRGWDGREHRLSWPLTD